MNRNRARQGGRTLRSPYLDDDTTAQADGEPVAASARWGPEPIEDDSWNNALWDAGESEVERYRGHRRTLGPIARYRWVGLAAVVVGLVAAIGLAVAPGNTDGGTSTTNIPSVEFLPATGEESATVASSPDISPSQVKPAVGPAGPASSSAPPPFPALTVEAEAGAPTVTLTGSAQVQQYARASGEKIVAGLGNWTDSGQDPGVLQVNGLAIPATGSYRIAIYYVNSGKPGARTATVSVSGVEPVSVTFTGGHNCCGVKYVNATLDAGTHTITIANPDNIAPSIDRIVISRP